jgi:hypothetical protein
MDENEITGFSWSTLFVVTTFSCFLFTGAIYMLDGKISFVFLGIALASLLLGILNRIVIHLKNAGKKKPEPSYGYPD